MGNKMNIININVPPSYSTNNILIEIITTIYLHTNYNLEPTVRPVCHLHALGVEVGTLHICRNLELISKLDLINVKAITITTRNVTDTNPSGT